MLHSLNWVCALQTSILIFNHVYSTSRLQACMALRHATPNDSASDVADPVGKAFCQHDQA